jgi:hypothetical protein
VKQGDFEIAPALLVTDPQAHSPMAIDGLIILDNSG